MQFMQLCPPPLLGIRLKDKIFPTTCLSFDKEFMIITPSILWWFCWCFRCFCLTWKSLGLSWLYCWNWKLASWWFWRVTRMIPSSVLIRIGHSLVQTTASSTTCARATLPLCSPVPTGCFGTTPSASVNLLTLWHVPWCPLQEALQLFLPPLPTQ